MAFLTDRCARVPLSPKIVAACAPFSCGNKDLDEFFSADYLDYAEQLMGKTYAFLEIENPSEIVCAFTVSNASIFTNHLPNARRKRVGKDVPWQKRDMIYPAVLIGRLGVNRKFMRKHVGTELMQSRTTTVDRQLNVRSAQINQTIQNIIDLDLAIQDHLKDDPQMLSAYMDRIRKIY